MPHINIKKGHDIRISGKPDKNIINLNNSNILAIMPTDFKGVKPKLMVKEGDDVRIGSPLFFDKNKPDIKWASPGAGKIINIEYGARRVIQKIEISLNDKQDSIDYKEYNRSDIVNLDRKKVLNSILEANIFPIFRQRPFNIIPDPAILPRDIFVSAVDSSPLGVDLEMVMVDEIDNFQAGIDVLNVLTEGNVYLTTKKDSVLASIQNAEINTISGPHPAGNIGIQIHHISHLKPGDSVWTVNSQDVLVLGKLFLNGLYDPSRVVTLGGPCVTEPGHFRITQGATMASIIGDRLNKEDSRIISGDVLTGRISFLEDYISYYDYTISIISNEFL